MLSKSLTQFSVDGQGCVPSLLFDLRPNYGGGNEDNGGDGGGLVAKSCPTLQPHGLSPQSSSVHGILQARILEWVAISFSRGSS